MGCSVHPPVVRQRFVLNLPSVLLAKDERNTTEALPPNPSGIDGISVVSSISELECIDRNCAVHGDISSDVDNGVPVVRRGERTQPEAIAAGPVVSPTKATTTTDAARARLDGSAPSLL